MKRAILLLVVVLAAAFLAAEETSQITVKASETANRVVIVTVQQGKAVLELQCNADMPKCKTLQPGTYWMEKLAKNRGMYECDNVLLYRNSDDAEKGDSLGNYCLNQK